MPPTFQNIANILDIMPQAYVRLDSEFRYTFVNRTAERLLRKDRADLLGKMLWEVYPALVGTPFAEHYRRAMAERNPITFENCYEAWQIWYEITATPDSDGGIVVHFAEITERKRAEQALRESEERFRSLVEQSADLIALTDANGVIDYTSPASERLFGVKPEEMTGCHFTQFLEESSIPTAVAAFQDALETGRGTVNLELLLKRKDGSVLIGELDSSVCHIASRAAILVIIRDITKRKREEAEREHLQLQLAQAQKMESIGRLAGGLAHDFNNLLMVINGYSAMALDETQPAEPLLHGLTETLRAGERAAALVRQLLAFSRKQVLQPEVLSLNATVGDMEKMLRRLVGEDIEIVVRLDPAVAPVLADRHQIEQVIMNLAVNARDAMPDGGTLTLETGERRLEGVCGLCHDQIRPGTYLELTVRDTGQGMDKHTLEHLFEPFFTTNGVGTGTGLGLSTVQGIVIQSGGHIRAESEVGQGSAFHIYLPVAERLTVEPGPLPLADAEGGAETILLVEDDQEIRRFIAAILGNYGYRVLETGDAEQALRVCATQPVDLLVTDVVMPKMRGVELARRARLTLPGLRTLFISGYSEDTHERNWASLADANFLQKPFAPKALATKVREVLERR